MPFTTSHQYIFIRLGQSSVKVIHILLSLMLQLWFKKKKKVKESPLFSKSIGKKIIFYSQSFENKRWNVKCMPFSILSKEQEVFFLFQIKSKLFFSLKLPFVCLVTGFNKYCILTYLYFWTSFCTYWTLKIFIFLLISNIPHFPNGNN